VRLEFKQDNKGSEVTVKRPQSWEKIELLMMTKEV
jgi:hypothetical protein